MYIENPKTKGSGILCCIPQDSTCPIGCADCFFTSGRSYLEPLDENLPNMPMFYNCRHANQYVVRVNDGNDSNNDKVDVIKATKRYPRKFYNTSIPDLSEFEDPVVLTVNPSDMTNEDFYKVDGVPPNLMFVRFRVNTWNLSLASAAVNYYANGLGVPVVLTFMAYHKAEDIPEIPRLAYYERKKRTTNEYWAITNLGWSVVLDAVGNHPLVYTCGKDANTHACKHCGNCLREYFATIERQKPDKAKTYNWDNGVETDCANMMEFG